MRVIIVDDEPQSHQVLETHLKSISPELQVIANALTIKEGHALIQAHQPDLVFLDIELPDGTGFDLMQKIGAPNFILIFITAHNKYAQQAIRYGALDFLLKPIISRELQDALTRAKEQNSNISPQQLQIMWESFQQLQEQQMPKNIAISTMEGIFFRQVKDIVRLKAENNYTRFIMATGEKDIIASNNIGKYEPQFDKHPDLMKVHRSSIINLRFVDRFVKSEGGHLVMKNGDTVSIAKIYTKELLRRLSG